MWPAIWPLAIEGLGRFTKTGAAFWIMGHLQEEIVALLYGKLADVYFHWSSKSILDFIAVLSLHLYYALRGPQDEAMGMITFR
jgi:fucose permease